MLRRAIALSIVSSRSNGEKSFVVLGSNAPMQNIALRLTGGTIKSRFLPLFSEQIEVDRTMERDSQTIVLHFFTFTPSVGVRICRVESAFALWRELSVRWLKDRDSKEIRYPGSLLPPPSSVGVRHIDAALNADAQKPNQGEATMTTAGTINSKKPTTKQEIIMANT
jgi:hypothetical protein